MQNLILFDQETQHYRVSVYKYFAAEFEKLGYRLRVVYDRDLNTLADEMFEGIEYSFSSFNNIISKYNSTVIILFVWLRYKFLLPFMLLNRLRGIRMISWFHGINLQKKNQPLVNQLYYLRQRLANALVLFSEQEKRYIRASHDKLFIANNTLNFHDFPAIPESKAALKARYHLENKHVILSVSRFDTHGRKVDYLIAAAEGLRDDHHFLVVGSGVSEMQQAKIKALPNISYLGRIVDRVKINEIYKLSDVFCMPGPIGLAINHAFYHALPVVIEDVTHGPEGGYLKPGCNGDLFNKGDVSDMIEKIERLMSDEKLYQQYASQARSTVEQEASIEKMWQGFKGALDYVNGNDRNNGNY